MADRAPYLSPSIVHVGMSKSSPVRQVRIYFWAVGIGPAFAGSGLMAYTELLTNLAAAYSIGLGTASCGWPAYNGITGDDPGAAEIDGYNYLVVTLTPTGGRDVTDGSIIINTPLGTAVIYIHGFTESSLIYDRFIDADATALKDHTPDTAPAGDLVGYQGQLGNQSAIYGDDLYPGCCTGNFYRGRLYSALHDAYCSYVDVSRGDHDGVAVSQGVTIRDSRVAGVTDGGEETIQFYFAHKDATHVWLNWEQRKDGTVYQHDYNFASIALAPNAQARLLAHIKGDQLRLYTGDAGGGNYVLQKTVTLATPWNDASHLYAGVVQQHYDSTSYYGKLLTFGSSQLAFVVTPSGGALGPGRDVRFASVLGAPAPPAQLGSIDAIPSGFPCQDLTATVAYVEGAGWLAVSLGATTTPAGFTMTVDPTGLAIGLYHATITLDSPDADSDPVVVDVEYEIMDGATLTALAAPGMAALLGASYHGATVAVARPGVVAFVGATFHAVLAAVASAGRSALEAERPIWAPVTDGNGVWMPGAGGAGSFTKPAGAGGSWSGAA